MHAYNRLKWLELPWQPTRICIQFDPYPASRVHLNFLGQRICLQEIIETSHFADLFIERNQREAEAEHDYGKNQQFFQYYGIFLDYAHCQFFTITVTNSTITMTSRKRAV